MSRTVPIKLTYGKESVMTTIQRPGIAPGWSGSKQSLTVHVLDVPDDVTDGQVIRLYNDTGIYHGQGSTWEVRYADLAPGKVLIVKDDDFVGVKEAAEILGWDKRKISTYVRRGVFPEPMQHLAGGKIWRRKQIEEYRDSKNGGKDE